MCLHIASTSFYQARPYIVPDLVHYWLLFISKKAPADFLDPLKLVWMATSTTVPYANVTYEKFKYMES